MAASRLSESDALGGFVIVAYPNTAEQAVFLDGYSESHNIDNLIVIFLDIPDDIALLRMRERGRAEYRQGFGQARLDLFRTEIAEVLAFYEGSVLTVDATKPQPEVDAAIDAFIRQSTP